MTEGSDKKNEGELNGYAAIFIFFFPLEVGREWQRECCAFFCLNTLYIKLYFSSYCIFCCYYHCIQILQCRSHHLLP